MCYDGFDFSTKMFNAFHTQGKGGAYGLDELSAKSWKVALNGDGLHTKESIVDRLSLPTASRT